MALVDIVGLNFFPTQILANKKEYSAQDVAQALNLARLKNGRNMMAEAGSLADRFKKPIILSEAQFVEPTQVGKCASNYSIGSTFSYLGWFNELDV